jgi:acetyl-CoA synthetase
VIAVDAPSGAEPVWRPSPEVLAGCNVMRFARVHGVESYAELLRRSLAEPEWFWDATVRHLGLEFSHPYEQVLDLREGPQWARWFVGGRLNLAWSCVGTWAQRDPTAIAVRGQREDGVDSVLTFGELWERVRRLAAGLQRLGVEPGDRVGLFLPMITETVVASHACALIGAVQVPLFSGFAAPAIRARLDDAEVKAVLTAEHTMRRGRPSPMRAVLDEALEHRPDVWRVVLGGESVSGGRHIGWDALSAEDPGDQPVVAFDAEHPYMLIYTSGTTGRPKGAVHATGGFLVKIAQEAAFQLDVGRDDTVHWVTDMGWLMGAWLVVGAGALGATISVAEGAINEPADRLWSLCEQHEVSVLGLSPTLVRGLMAVDAGDPTTHDLHALRTIGSTGEPWTPDAYTWTFDRVGRGRLPIINMTGGTEVGACFLSPTPAVPIKPCSVGGPCLGMAMDVFDEAGASLRQGVGELVCTAPWPSMTRGVWRSRERFLEAYWERFPGVWTHGDWAYVDPDGHWYILGRSDDTLNVAGKRIGSAEIEAALTALPGVREAAAVGVPHAVKGEAPWCVCVIDPPKPSAEEVAEGIARELGRSFLPAGVIFVPALPRTRSGKVMRRLIRDVLVGSELGDLSGLEDPATLDDLVRAVGSALPPSTPPKEQPCSS